jgi:hypothetical protein
MRTAKLTFLLLSLTLTFVKIVTACSCANLSLEQKRQSADAIFIGKVVGIKTGDAGYLEVNFHVVKSLKSVNESDVIVLTDVMAPGTCHYPFEVGGVYNVLAKTYVGRPYEGRLITSSCAGNSVLQSPPLPDNHTSVKFILLLVGGLFVSSILIFINVFRKFSFR